MKRSLFLRLVWAWLGLLGLLWLALEIPKLDIGTLFVVVVVGGCVLGILAVKFILPRIGDAVGTFVYSSGGGVEPDESSKAAAKVAQGDYKGAIVEYEKLLASNAEDTLAISEIAKLQAEKLNEPRSALVFLEAQIASRSWSQDNEAFLLDRLADIHLETLNNIEGALEVLEKIIAQFPNTRHSANAHHRVNEIHKAQFKALNQQRHPHVGDA